MSNEKNSQETVHPDWFGQFHRWMEEIRGSLELALTSMMEKEVKLTFSTPRTYTAEEASELFPEGPVVVTVRFSEPGFASWTFLIPKDTAAVIADLSLAGAGDKPFDGDVHPNAIGEVWRQAVEALEMELKTLTGGEVAFEPPQVTLDPEEVYERLGSWPVIKWDLGISDGEGFLLMAADTEFAGFMGESAAEPEPSGEDETASEPDEAVKEGAGEETPVAKPARFEDFGAGEPPKPGEGPRNLDMLLDINLPVTIELGRTSMLIKEILGLGPGSVIELDKMSGEPVDLLVNEKLFARGEVVVIEENFGVRITELVKLDERLKGLA